MATIEKALMIAAEAHAGQVDKEGQPYILHALRVMEQLRGKPKIIVGAGTVLTAQQAHDAIAAGATFLLAPNTSAEVAKVARENDVLYVAGAYTTNEILAAVAAGAHVVKVYPVGVSGGPHYIEVIRDPLPNIPFLAAGGTTLENTTFFLKAGCMAVGLGASLADPKLAVADQYDEITRRARNFVQRLAAYDAAKAPVQKV